MSFNDPQADEDGVTDVDIDDDTMMSLRLERLDVLDIISEFSA